MSTAVYIQVSSLKGQKTDSQRTELETWLKRHRYKAVQWFEDHESATTMQREAFQQLQAAIFAGEIKTVVVWKLDRLARSLKEGVNVLADWCQCGVRMIAITQQIDLSGPVGHLIASLLFGIAEIELQQKLELAATWPYSALTLDKLSPTVQSLAASFLMGQGQTRWLTIPVTMSTGKGDDDRVACIRP